MQKLNRKVKAATGNIAGTINSTAPEAFKQKAEATIAALTLPLGGSAALTSKLASKLTPIAGKKIAQGIASGTLSGGISGGAYGALNGITKGITDEKSAIDTLKQSGLSALGYGGLGALTGGTLGLAGGKIMQGIEGRGLKNFDTELEGISKLRNLEKQYYKNYIQGTTVKRNDLGSINFTNAGLETVSKYPNAGKEFAALKQDIKNAKYIGEELPVHERNDKITKFHRLKNGDKEFLIGEDKTGKKYYLSKNIKDDATITGQPSRAGAHASSSLSADNNIITDTAANFNPDKTALKNFKNYIESQKYLTGKLDVYHGRHKNRFYSKTHDSEENAIELASRQFNEILDKIKKNPELLNDLSKIEKEIDNLYAFPGFQEELYKKLYDIFENYNVLLEKNRYISPLDLQKIKEQVGHSINWQDETARNYKNPVLEQLYGRYMERLNTLSPELEKANKLYSYLRNFKKNEGLRRVLKAGDNIDTASSALKNYKNTITKGNTRRNINDLERVLTKTGYKPFLNQIDDINAAQDLQNSLPTGINFLGANNLLKGATALGLRGQRALNRSNLPAIYEQLILSHPELRIPLLYTGSNMILNSEE